MASEKAGDSVKDVKREREMGSGENENTFLSTWYLSALTMYGGLL